jgi:hypothetical protein
MLSLDDRPAPPAIPQFSREMEQFLVAAARAGAARQPARIGRAGKYAVAGLAAAAVVAAVAVGIDNAVTGTGPGVPQATPTGSAGLGHGGRAHVHLAAVSVKKHPDGTVTLTVSLTRGQLFDPAVVQQALAQAGVPALVTVGSVCTGPGPSDALPQVISRSAPVPGHMVTTIRPSAIPAGQKLSMGYFRVPGGGGLHVSLIPDNGPLTCSSTPPAPPRRHGLIP